MIIAAGYDHFGLLKDQRGYSEDLHKNFYLTALPTNVQDIVFDWDLVLFSRKSKGVSSKSWYVKHNMLNGNPIVLEVYPRQLATDSEEETKAVLCGNFIYILRKIGERASLLKICVKELIQIPNPDGSGSETSNVSFLEVAWKNEAEEKPLLLDISSNGKDVFGIDSEGGIYAEGKLISRLTNQNLVGIWSGFSFNVCLTDTGGVYTWGHGNHGELGHNICRVEEPTPRRLDFFDNLLSTVQLIACGGWHTLALTSDGDVYSWGWNDSGQLGYSDQHNSPEPYPVDVGTTEDPITSIACGSRHSAALSKNAKCYLWGSNKYGQLAEPTASNLFSPAQAFVAQTERSSLKLYCGRWTTLINTSNEFSTSFI